MSFITVSPFLSTPSARRATQQQQGQRQGLQISIHAIREEGDSSPKPSLWKPSNFYPRPPRGGRHIDEINDHIHKLFLSTPSARRATIPRYFDKKYEEISIHALREEGDSPRPTAAFLSSNFYPRPPRGGRPTQVTKEQWTTYFYPRPPRGGRQDMVRFNKKLRNFYPRPPRGGRRD